MLSAESVATSGLPAVAEAPAPDPSLFFFFEARWAGCSALMGRVGSAWQCHPCFGHQFIYAFMVLPVIMTIIVTVRTIRIIIIVIIITIIVIVVVIVMCASQNEVQGGCAPVFTHTVLVQANQRRKSGAGVCLYVRRSRSKLEKNLLTVQDTVGGSEVRRHLSSATTDNSAGCPPHMAVLMRPPGMGG